MDKKYTVVSIGIESGILHIKEHEVPATNIDNKTLYDIIGCHTVGVMNYIDAFNERRLTLWIDDNGAILKKPTTMVFEDQNGEPSLKNAIHGTIVITKSGFDGEEYPLSQSDIDFIDHWADEHELIYVQNKVTKEDHTAIVIKYSEGEDSRGRTQEWLNALMSE